MAEPTIQPVHCQSCCQKNSFIELIEDPEKVKKFASALGQVVHAVVGEMATMQEEMTKKKHERFMKDPEADFKDLAAEALAEDFKEAADGDKKFVKHCSGPIMVGKRFIDPKPEKIKRSVDMILIGHTEAQLCGKASFVIKKRNEQNAMIGYTLKPSLCIEAFKDGLTLAKYRTVVDDDGSLFHFPLIRSQRCSYSFRDTGFALGIRISCPHCQQPAMVGDISKDLPLTYAKHTSKQPGERTDDIFTHLVAGDTLLSVEPISIVHKKPITAMIAVLAKDLSIAGAIFCLCTCGFVYVKLPDLPDLTIAEAYITPNNPSFE